MKNLFPDLMGVWAWVAGVLVVMLALIGWVELERDFGWSKIATGLLAVFIAVGVWAFATGQTKRR